MIKKSYFKIIGESDDSASRSPVVIFAVQAYESNKIVVDVFILMPHIDKPVIMECDSFDRNTFEELLADSPVNDIPKFSVSVTAKNSLFHHIKNIKKSGNASFDMVESLKEFYSCCFESTPKALSEKTLVVRIASGQFDNQWREIRKLTKCTALQNFLDRLTNNRVLGNSEL